jgi:hypothetical protein
VVARRERQQVSRRIHAILVAALGGGTFVACRDVTAVCPAPTKPAILLTFADGASGRPISPTATIVYEHHGDDSLAVIRTTASGGAVAIGSAPGIYDLRVIAAGYNDWLTTNVVVTAESCETRTLPMTAFLQAQ